MKSLHRRHWEKRWGLPALDSFMGGRSFQAGDQEGLRRVLARPGVKKVLEVGPGSWHFSGAILGAGAAVTALELPFQRSAAMKPPGVSGWFSWRPHPLPWPIGYFSAAYQRNSVPNMETADISRALAEIARVADSFVWIGDLRCRFPIRPGGWVKAKILEHFAIESEQGEKQWRIMVLRPLRLAHERSCSLEQPPKRDEGGSHPPCGT